LNPGLDIEGVLLTMFDTRLRLSNQIVEEVKRYFGGQGVHVPVVSRTLSRSVKLRVSVRPVILYDGDCIGTRNYMELAKECCEETINSSLTRSHSFMFIKLCRREYKPLNRPRKNRFSDRGLNAFDPRESPDGDQYRRLIHTDGTPCGIG